MRAAPAAVKPSLTIQRQLNTGPDRVYAAWTEAEKIARWFGPSVVEQDSVKAKMDVRVGGSFQVSFKTDDGEFHQVGGIYREVVPNRKLVFSWAWHTTPEREVARHRDDQTRRQPHAADPDPRAVVRRGRQDRPHARLDRLARQAGSEFA